MSERLTEHRVTELLAEVIREVQLASGHTTPAIETTMCPIGGIEGFDSLMSVEASVMLESRLGFELPVETVFISQDGSRALNVGQVVSWILKMSRGES